MRLLALLILVSPAVAAVTSTTPANFTGSDPTAIGGKFAQRSTGPTPYPKVLTINGTGTWSIGTITGAASTWIACSIAGAGGPVYDCVLTGTAPATIYVYMNPFAANFAGAGTVNAIVPICNGGIGCTTGTSAVNVSINITVVARSCPGIISSLSGSFSGCSNSDAAKYCDLDTCTITNIRPGGTFNIPALGSTYAEPQFGSVIRRIAGGGGTYRSHGYSSVNPCNRTGTRCFVGSASTSYIIDPSDGTVLFTSPPAGLLDNVWDAYDPLVYHYMTGKTIHKVTLPALSDVLEFTYPGTATTITGGGTGDTSKDNWWAFYTDTDAKVCAINLSNVSQAPCATRTFSPSLGTPDFVMISKGTSVSSGKRYVFLNGTSYVPIWQFSDADPSLTFFGRLPVGYSAQYSGSPSFDTACTDAAVALSACSPSSHMDTVEISGEQYAVFSAQAVSPFMVVVMYSKIASGDLMTTAVETGGGATFSLPISDGNLGMHIACAKQAPYCAAEKYQYIPSTSWKVTNATNASPIVITSDTGYTGANNDVLLINNVGGNTAANGLCTVAGLSGTTFNCAGSTGNGTYTASTGSFTLNTAPATSPHGEEVLVIRGLNAEVRRIVKHRSIPYSDTYTGVGGYQEQPKTSILTDGSRLIFDSNFGFPDGIGVYSVMTGFVIPGTLIDGKVVLSGKVVIQ